MADLAAALALPVLLVVGLRLGCLNHALLTRESLAHPRRGLRRLDRQCASIRISTAPRENLATLDGVASASRRSPCSVPRRGSARSTCSAAAGRLLRLNPLSGRSTIDASLDKRRLERPRLPRDRRFMEALQQTRQPVRIVICPNCSLSAARARRCSSAACASFCFTLAGLLALRGIWPVLPFAGLEMLARRLGAACEPRAALSPPRPSHSRTPT